MLLNMGVLKNFANFIGKCVLESLFISLRLKNDRKRQEKLAQERLFARQDRKRNKPDEEDATSYTEPPKGSCLDIINTRIYNL